MRCDTFNVLIDGLCKNGMTEAALNLFEEMTIDGLVKANRFSEAEVLFQKVLEVGLEPDIILYTIMMRGLSDAGRMNDAMNRERHSSRHSML
ncbi:hypothetical protein SASPL_115342 [Salvia splendens]|uniref:Pentatricopeptide repeat-containing protein n=1 Tax=Salvia splendens TaxID=180675 RepID=A0A8X9A2Y1_SALSN|nr:hypothetical protein SASPL_115342 [Salvia splendens]